MLRRVVWYILADTTEVFTASIIRAQHHTRLPSYCNLFKDAINHVGAHTIRLVCPTVAKSTHLSILL
jgi:hypothetical protein